MIAELMFMAYSISKSRETSKNIKSLKRSKQKEDPIRIIDLRNLKKKNNG